MELLPEGQQNTTEVQWEDQKRINDFSTNISKKDRLTAQLKKIQEEKEYLDDLTMELELVDEDDTVRYKIGDAFVQLGHDEAISRVESENTRLEGQVEALESQIEELDSTLISLKHDLYAKFGDSINLER